MPLTHRALALLVAALYGEAGAPPVTWLYRAPDDAPVMFAVVRIGRYLIVVTRGSRTFMDWVHDAIALARSPLDHPEFGLVHVGFYDGITVAWEILAPMIGPDDVVIFLGHSLGSPHAEFLAAHMLTQMKRVPFVGRWAPPKPGFQKFADILAPAPGFAYDNYDVIGFDPVVELAWTTRDFPYVHTSPLTQVTRAPSQNILLDLGPQFAWHHFENYLAATPETPVVFLGSVAGG